MRVAARYAAWSQTPSRRRKLVVAFHDSFFLPRKGEGDRNAQ